MPSGREPPPGLGMLIRRTGSGRYVLETRSSRRPASHSFHACRLDHGERHPVHPRRSRIRASKRIGMSENVIAADLVVEHVEAEAGLRLRLAVELSLKAPELVRLLQGSSPITLPLAIVESAPEVRVLPLHRHYPGLDARTTLSDTRPSRRQKRRRWRDHHPRRVSPDYPDHPSKRAVPTTPGGSRQVRSSAASLPHAAFPVTQAGRHPHHHFRGLLRLHSRYGPLDRSTARGGLLSRGFSQAGYPTPPPASYQIKPTTIWVEPSSTGDLRRRGALNRTG